MSDEEYLELCRDSWEEGFERGHDAAPEELCGDRPHLRAALAGWIPTRRQQLLARARLRGEPERSADQVPLAEFDGLPYLPTGVCGKGGMGVVYAADDAQFARRVAVKQVRPDVTVTPEVERRFLREAVITAQLSHPGVVPVYGMGRDRNGRPYYVMRLVGGAQAKYADAIATFHAVTTRWDANPDRRQAFFKLVRQFVAAAQVIEYAHSKRVIHRDLKPANISIGRFGETVVLDWGLAKVLDGSPVPTPAGGTDESDIRLGTDSDPQTRLGTISGSPAYMAPEQADTACGPVDERTDVFGLGATLYQVLTGRPPYRSLAEARAWVHAAPREVKADAPRPLEAICRKAMSREPADRYQTAAALVADVEKWLADEPVSAWREPLGVRAARWVSRHRTLTVTSAAVVVLAVVALTVGLAAVDAERRRKVRAEAEVRSALTRVEELAAGETARRRSAESQLVSAKNASKSLTSELERKLRDSSDLKSMFAAMIPSFRERAAVEGTDELTRRAAVEAALSLASFEEHAGSLPAAAAAYQTACDRLEQLSTDFPEAGEYRILLGRACHQGGLLFGRLNDHATAIRMCTRAVEVRFRLATENPAEQVHRADLAYSLVSLATHLKSADRFHEAEIACLKSIGVRETLSTEYPKVTDYRESLGYSFRTLGSIRRKSGDLSGSVAAFTRAIDIREQLVVEYPAIKQYRRDWNIDCLDLAGVHRTAKQAELALALDRRRIDVLSKLSASRPDIAELPVELADAYGGLAESLRYDRPAEAVQHYLRAINAIRPLATQKPGDAGYARKLGWFWYQFGTLRNTLGQPHEAKEAFETARELQQSLGESPNDRQSLATITNDLGLAYRVLGERGKAAEAFEAARRLREDLTTRYPKNTSYLTELAGTWNNLGLIRRDDGDHAGSILLFTCAIDALESVTGGKLESELMAGLNQLLARSFLRNAYWNRAYALGQLDRYADGLADWDRAIELSPTAEQPRFRVWRTYATAKAGQWADARSRAAVLAKSGLANPLLLDLARTYSVVSRHLFIFNDEYQRTACGLIGRAVSGGWLNYRSIANDPDFATLRERPDFRYQLLRMAFRSAFRVQREVAPTPRRADL